MMKVFFSILLGLFLLCCSAHARFTHSKQYLAMEEEKLKNRLTMEQNWAKKFSHVQTNTYSGTPQNCQFVKPQIGFGAQVPTALTVCSTDDGTVCHQTRLFKCCENEELRGSEFKAGEHTLNLGSSKGVEVNFFYSGGGFGSRQPLGFCFTIDGSDGVCGDDLFGCSSNPTCGPSDDICEGNIVEGTCNPDPNPDNGGGCTCQRGYLAPNCCLCDFPDFFESSQSICEELCRENCAGAPTRFGCSSCQTGYQGEGCCECAPGYTRVGDRCEPVCDQNCVSGSLDPVTGHCLQCKPGFASEPTCCSCAEGYISHLGRCIRGCESNCASGYDTLTGCSRCEAGYREPDCCACDHHYFKVNGKCERVCDHNCVRNKYFYEHGCTHCREGYASEPLCCGCAPGYAKHNGQCIPVCARNCSRFTSTGACAECRRGFRDVPSCCECEPGFSGENCARDNVCEQNCVEGTFDITEGCGQCKPGYRGAPECCECAEGFTRTADGECVREVCDRQCVSGTFDPQSGCGQCRPGFAAPTCCDCQPPFVKVGTECLAPCPTNCQPGFFTEGSGCAAGRCRVGHQSPPLCCNCTEGFMQPFPGAPCTLIPTCRPDQRLENGVCVDICTGNTVFNPDTEECDVACGGNEDLIFLLDYSTSFRPRELRGIIGNLQLISNATDSRPNIRDAAIHYNIRASRISPTRRFTPSDYIYDYDATCKDTVDQLDNFAENRNIDNNRSFATESYSALNFVAREVPFTAGRRTSIVTITDGFSDAPDRISRIETEISSIKAKASAANARVRFFSIGVRAQNVPNTADIQEELKALADGVDRENNYIDYEQFTDNLLNLLVDANILCPTDRKSLSSDSTSEALDLYIDCSNGGNSCGTDELKITCSKQGLMTEILAAVQNVFNDAFKTQ